MTGTERAAMRLALGWARESVGFFHVRRGGPIARENRCVDEVDRLREFFSQCSGDPAVLSCDVLTAQAWQTPPRILRARLALYLRAVLRADAVDRDRHRHHDWKRHAVPLWSQVKR